MIYESPHNIRILAASVIRKYASSPEAAELPPDDKLRLVRLAGLLSINQTADDKIKKAQESGGKVIYDKTLDGYDNGDSYRTVLIVNKYGVIVAIDEDRNGDGRITNLQSVALPYSAIVEISNIAYPPERRTNHV